MTSIYNAGTVTVTNGSAAVVGIGTAWAIALVTGGTLNVEAAGNPVPILSVTDNTHLTGAVKWTGATGSYAYAIVRENSDAAAIVDVYDRMTQVLRTLSLAGVHPNESGSIANRDAITLGTDDEGFIFLHAEPSVAFAFYRWSGTAWEGPFPVADAAAGGPVSSLTNGPGIAIDSTNPAVPVVGLDPLLKLSAGKFGIGRTPTVNQMEVADTFSVVSTQPRLECVRYNPTPGPDGIPGPHIVNKAARGTESLPTALLLGDRLGNFGWRPHDGTSFQDYTVAALKAVAAENFSLAVCGTDVYLTTSAKGTNAEIERWRTSSEGQFLIGTSIARGANPSALLARLQVEGTDVAGASISITANTNAVTGPTIFLGKSRATVNGGLTIVQSGDTVGTLSFRGLDGASPASVASISGVVDGTPGAGDMPGRLVLSTTADGAASATERLRIDSVGVVSHRANAQVIIDANSHLNLRPYTVATVPSASVVGQAIYVSNGTANKRLAVSDGTNWRWPDGAIVS